MGSIELVLAILMVLFLCHQRCRINKERARTRNMRSFQLHSRENTFIVDPFAYSDPQYSAGAVLRQSDWKKHPFFREAGERATDYAERGFSIQGLNVQWKDVWNDAPYQTESLHLAKIEPGTVANFDGTTKGNRSLVTTPSRAYLPTRSWRRISEAASSPSMYLDTPSVAEDDELYHQPPTPTSITRPKTAVCPNQSVDWGTSTNKPCSHKSWVDLEARTTTPPGSEDNRGCPAAARQKSPSDELRQPLPPPRPPRNPLRRPPAGAGHTGCKFFFFPYLPPFVRSQLDDYGHVRRSARVKWNESYPWSVSIAFGPTVWDGLYHTTVYIQL